MRGILLCGGKSNRMGQKKQWLPFAGRPLLVHTLEMMQTVCEDVVVVVQDEEEQQRVQRLGVATVLDVYRGQGPLAGLHAGLAGLSPADTACLVGCDLPFLQRDVLSDLQRALAADVSLQAAVPQAIDRVYPVCAVYRGQVREIAADCLEKEANALRHFLAKLKVCYVPIERWRALDPSPFLNMNTPEDYATARTLWKKEGSNEHE